MPVLPPPSPGQGSCLPSDRERDVFAARGNNFRLRGGQGVAGNSVWRRRGVVPLQVWPGTALLRSCRELSLL